MRASRPGALPALLAVLAVFAGACQGGAAGPVASAARLGEPVRGGSFTEAVAGTAGYLNPLYADEDNAREIDGLIYQGLTRVTAGQDFEPLLAREVKPSANGLTYAVKLRTDVRWADGVPFTADDVLFTFGVLQDPAYDRAEATVWKGVTIKQAADDEVDFTLRAPSAGFLNSLRIGILPHHLFQGPVNAIVTSPYSGAKAIGTGPFQVESISADRSVVTLRRNPLANPAPYLERVTFKGYSTLDEAVAAVAGGDADAVGGLQSQSQVRRLQRPGTRILERRTFSFTSVFMDLTQGQPFFGNPAVRRALSQAIDRESIVREVLGGAAESQLGSFPPSTWAYSPAAAARYPYDPPAAARALTEAGWVMPDQGLYRTRAGRDFVVELVAADAFPYRQVAAAIRRQLAAVGVGVTLAIVPVGQLVARYLGARSFQMAIANLDNGPDPDQFSFWHSSQRAYPLNFSNLPKQSFIDKDLEDGRAHLDRPGRQVAYSDLQDLLADAAPALFLYEPHYLYAVSSRVQGIRMNAVIEPVDRFEFVAEWSVSS
ncbi:MAG: peptide-binding protein [Candidatus Dormibacteraceae bacterium]